MSFTMVATSVCFIVSLVIVLILGSSHSPMEKTGIILTVVALVTLVLFLIRVEFDKAKERTEQARLGVRGR